MSQEKSTTMPMQLFWEVKEVYYGIVQVENLSFSHCVVPENFPTHPKKGYWKFPGGGVLKSQNFQRKV